MDPAIQSHLLSEISSMSLHAPAGSFNFGVMPFGIRFLFCVTLLSLGVALAGCTPGQGGSDDEKEPHYVLGQSRVNAMDYQGAIEAFQESLEVNPHSAPAHFQLAMLYDTKVPDPAAAIYHYQQYLKYLPDAPNAAIVRQRIEACKQQLAADVLALPSTSATQQQLEKLVEQNRQLQEQLDRWRAYAAQLSAQLATNSAAQNSSGVTAVPNPAPVPNASPRPDNPAPAHSATTVSTARTHTVVAGETAMGIARKYGVKFSALQTVNLGVNLSKLRIGQVLNIP